MVWANPPFTEFERVVAKFQCAGTRVVVLVPYWPKQRWFAELYAMSSAQVMLKSSKAQYRKEGEGELMPLAGWDNMLLKSDTTSTPSPMPRKFLTKGESDAGRVGISQCSVWRRYVPVGFYGVVPMGNTA